MEGFKLKIMEITDGGQFECRTEDGGHFHDISLKVNCELNNDHFGRVRNASVIAKSMVSSTTVSTSLDGVGHNSSNHPINATHNKINSLPNSTSTTSTTTISAHAVPAATEALSARNQNNNNSVVNNDDVSVFATPTVDSVVVNPVVAMRSKRFRG